MDADDGGAGGGDVGDGGGAGAERGERDGGKRGGLRGGSRVGVEREGEGVRVGRSFVREGRLLRDGR